jgi:glycosyltransferase involved in cell wall biosynthesis
MRRPVSRSRKRILFMIDFVSSSGGAERLAVALATHLPQDRFEPWICATRRSDAVATRALSDAGVRHLTLGRSGKWDIGCFATLAALLRRERVDVLHTHKFGSNVWGALIGSACRVPVIVAHEHGWAYEGDAARTWLDGNVVGRLATKIVAVSQTEARRMVNAEGIARDKVVIIPNGYIPSPASSEHDIRAELGLDGGALVIAIAALLRSEKRLDLLLNAHARVRAALPHAHLVIAGDGPCRGDLERQAHTLGLDDSVHFLGARTDVDSLLQAADVGALTSDREGSPLLAFECMANATPLVATAVGGIPDVIEHGRTGLLVPPGDPDAFAEGLIALLSDPERRERIAAAAREALGRYTIEATAARFASLYDTLIAAG